VNIRFFMAMRCTSQQYAKSLVERGCIKFNTPQSWVDYEKKHGKGRGDLFEGTFASCYHGDLDRIKKIAKQYRVPSGGIYTEVVGPRLYYKRHSSMNLPAFCLYILKEDAFEYEPIPGWQDIKTTIPGSYFKDFVDNMTETEVKALPEQDQPAIVVFSSFEDLKNRIIQKLLTLGIKRNEILEHPVQYYDYNQYGPDGWFELPFDPPGELAIKSKTFENQSELRFVINSKNKRAMDYLRNNVIEIGPLNDIAQVVCGYFPDGIAVSMRAYLEEISDAECGTSPCNDL